MVENQFTAYELEDICHPLKMSWCKDSTAVSLSGLTVHEAAKGALLCEEFQKMPDPLFKVPNYILSFPYTSVMNEVIKDNLKCFCTYTVKYKKC